MTCVHFPTAFCTALLEAVPAPTTDAPSTAGPRETPRDASVARATTPGTTPWTSGSLEAGKLPLPSTLGMCTPPATCVIPPSETEFGADVANAELDAAAGIIPPSMNGAPPAAIGNPPGISTGGRAAKVGCDTPWHDVRATRVIRTGCACTMPGGTPGSSPGGRGRMCSAIVGLAIFPTSVRVAVRVASLVECHICTSRNV